MSKPHTLYVRRSCPFCAEAEALLQAEGVVYLRVVVVESEKPGEVVLLHPDGRRERRTAPRYFQTPALVDAEAGATLVGLAAIEEHIDVL